MIYYICIMRIRKPINIENEADTVLMAQVASALSHPIRIALLNYVKSKNTVRNDVCNKDLVAHFPYSQSSLSQHVKKLVEAQLFVVVYKDKYSFYSVNMNTLNRYIELLQSL
ncbi:MAG TPA: hypothetical protein DCS93_08405 [Microscillaceae bacterium]|nr:hypothetical protein [Microscillaceae bacterium]